LYDKPPPYREKNDMPSRAAPLPCLLALVLGLVAITANAADVSVRDLTQRLYRSDPSQPLDISYQDLRNLDLSGLDFKGAKLQGSNLFGADLRGADLSNADLRDAHLDRVIIIGARFDAANLAGASMLRPSAFSSMSAQRTEAVSFAGADLHGARIFARLNGANLSKANLSGATFAPFGRTGFIEHIWRTELLGANMSEADLAGADLTHALLAFADLRGAKLNDAVLKKADLSRADLTGADLTGADLSEADLDGAILVGVRGLDTVQGLASALNVEKMVR
jgi:uncharacterized protein YjbI with pentapeptide repeats